MNTIHYSRRRLLLIGLVLLIVAMGYRGAPPEARAAPTTDLILSGNIDLSPSVYVFAQNESSFGIYYINNNAWQLVTSVPVSAVTVDSVKAKLAPGGQLVSYLITDGETGNSALYSTNIFGMGTKVIYASPHPALAVTSFAWHGSGLLAYTLARGPFAKEDSNGTSLNPTETSAAMEYMGELWLSTTDGISQTQVISSTVGAVVGSVNAAGPIYYTTVATETQELTGLNSVAASGEVLELFRSTVDSQGQGTIYLNFELVRIGAQQHKLAMVTADAQSMTMPEHGTRLLTANLDGTNVSTIVTDTADIAQAAWSPDGSKVAFVRGSTGKLTIRELGSGTSVNLPNSVQSNIQWTTGGSDLATTAALNSSSNPFTAGFNIQSTDGSIIASASTQANATTAFSEYKVPGTVPYVHQKFDTPASFGGKNDACGSTSVVMALGYLGKINGPFGNRVPEFHPWSSYGREPAEKGLNSKGVANQRLGWGSLQDIIYALERNHVVIASTTLTSVGHIVLIVGYKRSGNDVRLITNDSWGDKNADSYGNLNNGRNAVYTWEQMGVAWTIEVQATASGTPPPDPNQWRAEYFNNKDLGGSATLVRNDSTIDFDWGVGGPGGGVNNDNFSARWTKRINFPSSGIYRFRTTSDDGMRLWVDGRAVLNQWYPHAATQVNTDVYVAAGDRIVRVEFYEEGGGALARVGWERLNVANTWEGSYYNNRDLAGTPAFIRQDSSINFNWGSGSSGPGVGPDNFSARWTRSVQLPGGAWQFYTRSDDGSRVFVDGALAVNQWWDHGDQSAYSYYRYLNPGTHSIAVDFYEHGGGAGMEFGFWPRIWAEYFDQPDFSGTRLVAVRNSIDHNWLWSGPHKNAVQSQDNFSTRFTWPVSLSGGDYRICLDSDDGFRFFVDSQLRINRWHDSNNETCSVINIGAGWRTFRLEHYENGGWAKIRFSWGRANGSWYGTGLFPRDQESADKMIYITDGEAALHAAQPTVAENETEFFQLLNEQGTLGLGLEATEETPYTNSIFLPMTVR